MQDYTPNVERNGNLILNCVRKHPASSAKELHMHLSHDNTPVKLVVVRQYVKAMHKAGYLKKTITVPSRYTAVNEKPFTYVKVTPERKK